MPTGCSQDLASKNFVVPGNRCYVALLLHLSLANIFLGPKHEDTELTFKTLENVEAGSGQSSLSQVAGGAAGVVKVDKESGEEVAKNKMTMIMIVELQPLIIKYL